MLDFGRLRARAVFWAKKRKGCESLHVDAEQAARPVLLVARLSKCTRGASQYLCGVDWLCVVRGGVCACVLSVLLDRPM